MIDTHAHIDFESFDQDRNEIIERASSSGLETIIIPGVEPKDFNNILDLSKKYDKIFCAMGVHPHNANDYNDEVKEKIITNAQNNNVKAIGEIGIDYYYDYADSDTQKNVFREQLKIAKELKLPVIIHNREADEDIYNIVKEEQNGNLNAVLHCFSSDVEFMKKSVDLGLHISFTGIVTFKNSNLTAVVKEVPNDKFMIETDSPFLAPVPKRGKRNEPSYVRYIAEKISEIKSINIDEVISMTTNTAKKFFNLTVLVSFFILFSISVLAQKVDDDMEFDEDMVGEEFIHPFPKFIGIGPMFGSNTVVETYFIPIVETNKTRDDDISYEGLLNYGFGVTYGVLDYLVVGVTYNYSKNTKIVEEQDGLIDPTIYQNLEFTTNWIINPYSRVNFYGMLGISYLFNSYSTRPDPEQSSYYIDNNQLGINTGLGFYINIPTNFGLFNFIAEWKLNFETEDKQRIYGRDLSKGNSGETVDTRSFYSIPRIYIMYYPQF